MLRIVDVPIALFMVTETDTAPIAQPQKPKDDKKRGMTVENSA
jgi:hypothetical protein